MKTFKVGYRNGKVKRGKSPRNLRRENQRKLKEKSNEK